MDSDEKFIYIFILIMLLIIARIIFYYFNENVRKKKIKALSAELGFLYDEKKESDNAFLNIFTGNNDNKESDERFYNIGIFDSYGNKRFKNIIKGKYNKVNWEVFDYDVKKGKSSMSYTIYYTKTNKTFSHFMLTKKGFFTAMKKAFGTNEISLTDPNFSKRYFLSSDSETETRNIFTSNITNLLNSKNYDDFTIEVNKNHIFIYSKRMDVSEIKPTLDNFSELVRALDKDSDL